MKKSRPGRPAKFAKENNLPTVVGCIRQQLWVELVTLVTTDTFQIFSECDESCQFITSSLDYFIRFQEWRSLVLRAVGFKCVSKLRVNFNFPAIAHCGRLDLLAIISSSDLVAVVSFSIRSSKKASASSDDRTVSCPALSFTSSTARREVSEGLTASENAISGELC